MIDVAFQVGRRWGTWRLASTVLALSLVFGGGSTATGQDETKSSEAATAKYADAANFQTNGAFDLAITAWKEFLQEYPQDRLAPKAAHYLGVCYMQREQPDYDAAAAAFARALKNPKYDLREESLFNRGWCLYAASGQGVQPGQARDQAALQETIATFRDLVKNYPRSNFLDQAYFFSGEAAYALGEPQRAVQFYGKLLTLPNAKESSLRCDALYATGVAQEEMQAFQDAAQTYRRLLTACGSDDPELAQEVRVRLGDVLIVNGDPEAAAKLLAEAAQAGGENAPYAAFRRAFALAQSKRTGEAAQAYEAVIADYPQSRYAAAAILASAQSSYIAGDLETAQQRFQQVIARDNLSEATEAAHWLAQIALRENDAKQAADIAAKQIERGAEGPYALALRLDQAEALSLLPDQAKKSLALFAEVYRADPQGALASRALYSAAFAAMQTGDLQRAIDLSSQFLRRFKEDPLVDDVRYIAAESRLLGGQHDEALKAYKQLLGDSADNPQRPEWTVRGITAAYLAGEYDQAIQLAESELDGLRTDAQKAEAMFLIGASHLFAKRPAKAIESLQQARRQDTQWPRRDEALLLLGQAQQDAGKPEAAVRTWTTLTEDYPDRRMADQALFRLGQQAANQEKYDQAIEQYQNILDRDNDAGLLPYALFNKGWCLVQQQAYDAARPVLQQMLGQYPDHPLRNQTQLAFAVAARKTNNMDAAIEKLRSVIDSGVTGTLLGNSRYELAQVYLERDQPGQAIPELQRIVIDLPDFPTLQRVLYDLGWALKENGNVQEASKTFELLLQKFPEHPLAAEAHYFVAEQAYDAEDWLSAAEAFAAAAAKGADNDLIEKSFYNQGWSLYQAADYESAEKAFGQQVERFPAGDLSLDGMLMVGESRFKRDDFETALKAYRQARDTIESRGEDAQTLTDAKDRQIRELVYLHGGQSLAQLKRWEESIEWLEGLRERFPNSQYLPQTFFQIAYAHQQLGNNEKALTLYGQVAGKYRDETAARSRFMRGEIYFAERDLAKAIPEFQRAMYGFGAEKAPPAIKNWQAKSGFEAGRCAELLIQAAQGTKRDEAIRLARDFFNYVIEKHPDHELVGKARERLQVLNRL